MWDPGVRRARKSVRWTRGDGARYVKRDNFLGPRESARLANGIKLDKSSYFALAPRNALFFSQLFYFRQNQKKGLHHYSGFTILMRLDRMEATGWMSTSLF